MTTMRLKPRFALLEVEGPKILERCATGNQLPYEDGSVVTKDDVFIVYQDHKGRKELFAVAMSGSPDKSITTLNQIAESVGSEKRAYRPDLSEVTIVPATLGD